jgi:hypothetical protein
MILISQRMATQQVTMVKDRFSRRLSSRVLFGGCDSGYVMSNDEAGNQWKSRLARYWPIDFISSSFHLAR